MSFYTFLPKLLSMSLTASVAIVLVLLARLLLKKAPKVISYALWGIVLIRLLCPVSIESSFSLFGLMDTPTKERGELTSSIEYVPNNIVHTEYPTVALPVPGISDVINGALPKGEEQLRADPLEGPIFLATYTWIVGVLGMAVYAVVSYIRLRRKLIIASPLRDNIWYADEISSPFVLGLVKPKIYIPSSMPVQEQSFIILHEQHHIRRLDHIMKAVAFGALCIHWFNPLVWVAFIMACKDMEMSCDEAVVKKLGEDVLADYTASLLSLATGRHIIAGMPLAFGEGDTKGRIRNLANWKKPAFWVILAAVIVCAVLAICLLTNPTGDDIPKDPASDDIPENPTGDDIINNTTSDDHLTKQELSKLSAIIESAVPKAIADKGTVSSPAGLELNIKLKPDDGRYVVLLVENLGSNPVAATIEGKAEVTVQPGEKQFTAVNVTQSDFSEAQDCVFKVAAGKSGETVNINYVIYQMGWTDVPYGEPSQADSVTFAAYGSIFFFGEYSFDLNALNGEVNAVALLEPVGNKIVVAGHVNPNILVYFIFDPETKTFEKEIVGACLTWHSNDLSTAVYSFRNTIRAYDGTVIKEYTLKQGEYIEELLFVENNSALDVVIDTGEDLYKMDRIYLSNIGGR